MKKTINISLILIVLILGFFVDKEFKYNALAKIVAIAILMYLVLNLSQKIKSKE